MSRNATGRPRWGAGGAEVSRASRDTFLRISVDRR